jgi:hypothetical protein
VKPCELRTIKEDLASFFAMPSAIYIRKVTIAKTMTNPDEPNYN